MPAYRSLIKAPVRLVTLLSVFGILPFLLLAEEQAEQDIDPALERIRLLVSQAAPTVINNETLKSVDRHDLSITISLETGELQLIGAGKLVLRCPIAFGHVSSSTPTGTFRIVRKEKGKKMPDRGAYIDSSGRTLLADVDRLWDSMPSGASFEPRPVAYRIVLDGKGPTIESGVASRSGTTRGDIRVPSTAAAALFDLVSESTPVIIKD